MRKIMFLSLIVLFTLLSSNIKVMNDYDKEGNNSISLLNKIPRDYIPDEETAKKIAEAIWFPIYGDKIYDQKPFVATLSNDLWIVKGTLAKGKRGGVAYIEIQKKDCRILKVSHSR